MDASQPNAEIFTLTYGSIVKQLIADLEDLEEVNKQLDQMGYNIGIRLVDEFLAKAKISRCTSFKDTAEVVAKQALSLFLNITANITNWDALGTECSLILQDTPLTDFVELPEDAKELKYINILCGVIRGALEMVNMDVEAKLVQDMLKGDDCFEIRLRLKQHKDEQFPYKDDE
ncbi:MAG: hypothetical protein WDW36_001921 [Sanguina aurantia]